MDNRDSLNDVVRRTMLYDFYAGMLTERQREAYEMRYLQDMSLAETADELNISRQAVNDLVKRTLAVLEEFEEKLGFIKEHERRDNIIQKIKALPSSDGEILLLLDEINRL